MENRMMRMRFAAICALLLCAMAITARTAVIWPYRRLLLLLKYLHVGLAIGIKATVSKIKVEADGDVHIELVGDHDETVVVEVPLEDIPTWCSIREQVFSCTKQHFPFNVTSGKTLTLNDTVPKLITVIGKCFYDIDHAPKDHSNRRPGEPNKAVWEIHPVMEIRTANETD